MTEFQFPLQIEDIQQFLPHRAPFLLVDRILSITLPHPELDLGEPNVNTQGMAVIMSNENTVGTKVVGLKNVTFNEPFFPGHFPTMPIVPGVLVCEMMAQVASFSVYPFIRSTMNHSGPSRFSCILVGVDGARFRKPVIPGDQLKIETVVTKRRALLWGFSCKAYVDGQLAAEADIMANLIDRQTAQKEGVAK